MHHLFNCFPLEVERRVHILGNQTIMKFVANSLFRSNNFVSKIHSMGLRITNNFYKNFQQSLIHVRLHSYTYGQVLFKFARIQKFGCLNPRLSRKLNVGVGGI